VALSEREKRFVNHIMRFLPDGEEIRSVVEEKVEDHVSGKEDPWMDTIVRERIMVELEEERYIELK